MSWAVPVFDSRVELNTEGVSLSLSLSALEFLLSGPATKRAAEVLFNSPRPLQTGRLAVACAVSSRYVACVVSKAAFEPWTSIQTIVLAACRPYCMCPRTAGNGRRRATGDVQHALHYKGASRTVFAGGQPLETFVSSQPNQLVACVVVVCTSSPLFVRRSTLPPLPPRGRVA